MRCQCNELSELEGSLADDYVNNHLIEIRKDVTMWISEYICPDTRIHWIEDKPHSERHGGGPTRLRKFIGEENLDEFTETRIRSYICHRQVETKINCLCNDLTDLTGDFAENYSWNHLFLMRLDNENWTTELMCPKTAIRWQMKWENDSKIKQGNCLLRKI